MSDQPKKRVKKRYTTKEQIVAQIDKFTAKKEAKSKRAAQLLHDAKDLRRIAYSANPGEADASMCKKADRMENDAHKLGVAIKLLEERVLPNLKNKLSEFQTEVMPGFLPDNSVEGM